MNGRHFILAVQAVAAALVSGCDRVDAALHPKPTPPSPYAFSMAVQMTPRVAAAMKAQESSIRVSAFYYGFARPQFRDKADKLNRIQLSKEYYDYPRDATTVNFPATDIDMTKLDQIERGEIWVLTEVGSIDKSRFPTDLLDCKDFTGPVEVARTVPQTATCDLGEEYR